LLSGNRFSRFGIKRRRRRRKESHVAGKAVQSMKKVHFDAFYGRAIFRKPSLLIQLGKQSEELHVLRASVLKLEKVGEESLG